MKNKILVFARYLSYHNGAATYLANLSDTNHEVVFLVLRRSVYDLGESRVIIARNRFEYLLFGLWHSLTSYKTVSTYGPGFFPWKNICIIHDLLFMDFAEHFDKRFRCSRLIYFFIGSMCKDVVTVSHYSSLSIKKYFKRSSWVIPFSMELTRFTEGQKPLISPPYFISIGRFEKRKGQFEFLQEYIRRSLQKKIVFVGTDSGTLSRCIKLVEDNHLTNRIFFLSDLSELEKFSLLANAKAYLQLSKCEGFGIPVLESLYYQVPVIGLVNSALQDFHEGYSVVCNDYSEIGGKLDDKIVKGKSIDLSKYKPSNFLTEWEKLFS